MSESKMAEDLPQITNESELREAMNGSKTMYAVLNAPVSGSAVDDPFELLTDEYFYILYMGEIYKDDFYYQDGLGAQSSYKWMTDYDTRELMSAETFLYDDIPIDMTVCAVNGPDQLTSAEQVNFPEKTSIDSDYLLSTGPARVSGRLGGKSRTYTL